MTDARRTCHTVAEEMLAYVRRGYPIDVAATLCTRHGDPRPGAGVNSPGRPKESNMTADQLRLPIDPPPELARPNCPRHPRTSMQWRDDAWVCPRCAMQPATVAREKRQGRRP